MPHAVRALLQNNNIADAPLCHTALRTEKYHIDMLQHRLASVP